MRSILLAWPVSFVGLLCACAGAPAASDERRSPRVAGSAPEVAGSPTPAQAPCVETLGSGDVGSPPTEGPAAPAPLDDECATAPWVRCVLPDRECRFAGSVIELRAASGPASVGTGEVPGLLIVLGTDPCAEPIALEGVPDAVDVGPFAGPTGPRVEEAFVSSAAGCLPPLGLALGQCVAGAVGTIQLGYDRRYEAVVFADGVLVFAEAPAIPRAPTPLAGWTFERGELRRTERTGEDYWLDSYDLRVTVGDEELEIVAGEGVVAVDIDGGTYLVEASAYGTRGTLPPWLGWMRRAGYGFRVLRAARE